MPGNNEEKKAIPHGLKAHLIQMEERVASVEVEAHDAHVVAIEARDLARDNNREARKHAQAIDDLSAKVDDLAGPIHSVVEFITDVRGGINAVSAVGRWLERTYRSKALRGFALTGVFIWASVHDMTDAAWARLNTWAQALSKWLG